ncbi:MAG: FAD:protein FMN transferase [Phaeodactylibacter sp.]|nr:FAD:protein FMN transferase [Phaeodactylibacter sp.]
MKTVYPFLCFAVLIAAPLKLLGQPAPVRWEYQHPQMGTLFRLVLYAADSVQASEAARAAFRRIDSLNAILSDYLPDSELSVLSDHSDWAEVSPALEQVLRKAQEIASQTDGAFDITVGPLSRLWRRTSRQGIFPDSLELAAAREKVGYQNLLIQPDKPLVKLLLPGMRLDAGGIAKGFAVDEAMAVLRSHGLPVALVDGGGDLLAGEAPPGKEGWEIEVVGDTVLVVTNRAVATSGAAYRHLDWQGRRYSHIIGPKEGLGVLHGKQVTVVAPSCMLADALATALSVEPGLETRLKAIYQDSSFRMGQAGEK